MQRRGLRSLMVPSLALLQIALLGVFGCGDSEAVAPASSGEAGSDAPTSQSDGSTPLTDATPDLPDARDGSSSLVDQQVAPAAIAVVNHSFELPATGPNSFLTAAAPPGWQTYGTGVDFGSRTVGVLNPNASTLYLDAVPHGQNVGVVFLLDTLPVATEAGMQQTLSETLAPGTTYALRVDVGNINPVAGLPYDFTGFPGYRIDLLAGGAVIASDAGTLSPGEGRFLLSTVTVSIGASHARAGQPLGIRLVNLDGAPGIEVNFDNVRLTQQRP